MHLNTSTQFIFTVYSLAINNYHNNYHIRSVACVYWFIEITKLMYNIILYIQIIIYNYCVCNIYSMLTGPIYKI